MPFRLCGLMFFFIPVGMLVALALYQRLVNLLARLPPKRLSFTNGTQNRVGNHFNACLAFLAYRRRLTSPQRPEFSLREFVTGRALGPGAYLSWGLILGSTKQFWLSYWPTDFHLRSNHLMSVYR
jgi:hypothetical protein